MPKYRVLVAIVGANFSFAQGDEVEIIPNGEAEKWLKAGIVEEIGKSSPIQTATAKMDSVETTSKKRK